MKINNILFSTAMLMALTLPIFGQSAHYDKGKKDMEQQRMTKMMGKPALDATAEGLHMKVWLITQKQHKKMMKEMKLDGMGMKDTGMAMGKDMKGMNHGHMEMDKAAMKAMMAGTHCVMLSVTDAVSGNDIDKAMVKLVIVSPSKMNSSFDLKPVMKHFGTGLTLSEKGKYEITVSVSVNGVSTSKEFHYAVK